MARLIRHGYRLIPLGGDDGKRPLRKFAEHTPLSLRQTLGPMHGADSACYGILLGGLAVIDCDDADAALISSMEARFGVSPVHVQTPRGMHMYFSYEGGALPNLRGESYAVDIKRGPTSYVVGPQSVRPDGGIYLPVKGLLGIDVLPVLQTKCNNASPKLRAHSHGQRSGSVENGSRHNALVKKALSMVEYVDSQAELLDNLVYFRDEECEDPETVPISELNEIADWVWKKRLEGKVYHRRKSEFKIERTAVSALAGQQNMSDALALYTVLVSVHGHQLGKAFKLSHQGMREAGHTDLSRRRFREARRTLEQVDLLRVAKRHSSSRSATCYQLCRPHHPAANIVPVA